MECTSSTQQVKVFFQVYTYIPPSLMLPLTDTHIQLHISNMYVQPTSLYIIYLLHKHNTGTEIL